MTMLQWFLLCGVFTVYLLLGGAVFMALERGAALLDNEGGMGNLTRDVKEVLLRIDHNLFRNEFTTEEAETLRLAKEEILEKIYQTCGPERSSRLWEDSIPDTPDWDFYNSVMYGFTIVTTIGYGHLTPKSNWSRLVAILYGLIGIPINGILLKHLGDFFSDKLMKVYYKSKGNNFLMFSRITVYLLPGLIMFIFLPAGLFTYIEKWTYIESLYFACISLMTIGFGDFVPGKAEGNDPWLGVYKGFIIIWIQFGLGFVFMIISFITKGLTHKKIRQALQKRTTIMRSAKERLLEDLEDMRRAMEEPYLQKEEEKPLSIKRSGSQPCLDLEGMTTQIPLRKKSSTYRRTVSEADGDQIVEDVQQPQTRNAMPEHLLAAMARVVEDVLVAVDEISDYKPEKTRKMPIYPGHRGHPGDFDSSRPPTEDSLENVVVIEEDDPNLTRPTGIMKKMNRAVRKISTMSWGATVSNEKLVANNSSEGTQVQFDDSAVKTSQSKDQTPIIRQEEIEKPEKLVPRFTRQRKKTVAGFMPGRELGPPSAVIKTRRLSEGSLVSNEARRISVGNQPAFADLPSELDRIIERFKASVAEPELKGEVKKTKPSRKTSERGLQVNHKFVPPSSSQSRSGRLGGQSGKHDNRALSSTPEMDEDEIDKANDRV